MNDINYTEPLSDSDFIELLIRHMILSPEVYAKAKLLKITGEDVMLDDTYGNVLYKALIDIVNEVSVKPIPASTLLDGLKKLFDNETLHSSLKLDALKLFEYFYDDSRLLESPDFFDNKLTEFIKKRRAQKLVALYKDDITTLTRELNKLSLDSSGSELSRPRIINPFVSPIYKTKTNMIGTGLSKLDEKLDGGLLLGECALLIGHSGGCKTTLGSNIVGLSAEMGRPSTYISCEEHETEISQRMYSRVYRIPYRQLRQGIANLELESRFSEEMLSQKREKLAKNLCLIGLKGIDTEITADYLYEVLLQHYEKTGFVPEIVMIDQMQFVLPASNLRKGIATWEVERVVACELDELSHRKIGNKGMVVWVEHQAKGKTKLFFTRDDIDGFKGIVQKYDLALGIGRANEKSNEVNLFTLKVRHSADFQILLRTELEYMTIKSELVSESLTDLNNETTITVMNNSPIIS